VKSVRCRKQDSHRSILDTPARVSMLGSLVGPARSGRSGVRSGRPSGCHFPRDGVSRVSALLFQWCTRGSTCRTGKAECPKALRFFWPLAAGRWPLTAIVAVWVIVASSAFASPDPPVFELTEIAVLGFEPDVDLQGRFGINSAGQIAFTRMVNGVSRASLYLPEPAYGFPSAGIVDLPSVFVNHADQGAPILTGHSYARDISDGGFIVGQFGGTGYGLGTAFLIDLADLLSLENQVQTWLPDEEDFPGESDLDQMCGTPWSRAMAVDGDDAHAFMIVESGFDRYCIYSGCSWFYGHPLESRKCFASAVLLTVVPNEAPTATLLDQIPCTLASTLLPSTRSYAVRQSISQTARYLAGIGDRGDPFVTIGETCPHDPVTPVCEEFRRPIRGVFDANGQGLSVLTPLAPGTLNQAIARGVNVEGDVVGFSWVTVGQGCQEHAALWPMASSIPVSLHDPDVTQRSRAEAVNRCSRMRQAVGWAPVSLTPLLWLEDEAGDWTSWRLRITATPDAHDAEILCTEPDCELIRLHQAVAVNDDGWIIVIGYVNDNSIAEADRHRLYLLRPAATCGRVGDLTGDGSVELADLLMLLSAWGPCTCPWCPEDLTGDGEVNFTDLTILLANWGGCNEAPMGLPQSLLDCIDRVGLDPVALAACASAISDPEHENGGSE